MNLIKTVCWGLILVLVGLYFYYLHRYALNIPLFDDHAFKNFLIQYQETSVVKKILLVFSQHNEHRVAFTRLVVLGVYMLQGELNYITMMWVGNALLLLLCFVFYRLFQLKELNHCFLIPIACLVFSFQHYENTFWGMASVQNFGVVVWSVLSFWLLVRRHFAEALFVSLVATYTSGNGFLANFICLFVLLLMRQKRWVITFGALSLLNLLAYFWGYSRPPGNPTAPAFDFVVFFKTYCAFLGSVFAFDPSVPSTTKAIFWGGILLVCSVVFLGVSFKNYLVNDKNMPALEWFIAASILFVLATGGLVVLNRLGFGTEIVLISRYKIYSMLLVALFISLLAAKIKDVRLNNNGLVINFLCLLGGGIYWLYTAWQAHGEVIYHHHYLLSSAYNSRNYPKTPKAIHYKAPKLFFDEKPTNTSCFVAIDSSQRIANQQLFFIETLEDTHAHFALLKNDTGSYMFPIRQRRNLSKRNALLLGDYFIKGGIALITDTDLPAGNYRLELMSTSSAGYKQCKTNKNVEIRPHGSVQVQTNW